MPLTGLELWKPCLLFPYAYQLFPPAITDYTPQLSINTSAMIWKYKIIDTTVWATRFKEKAAARSFRKKFNSKDKLAFVMLISLKKSATREAKSFRRII